MEDTKKQLIQIQILQDNHEVYQGEFELGSVSIGRSSDNHICLRDYPWLSRRQALLQFDGENFELIDLTGSDKIFFENKGTSRCLVTNGSNIYIGNLRLQFTLPQMPSTSIDDEVTATATQLDMDKSVPHVANSAVNREEIISHPTTPDHPSYRHQQTNNLSSDLVPSHRSINPSRSVTPKKTDDDLESDQNKSQSVLPLMDRPGAVIKGLRALYNSARRDLMTNRDPRVLEAYVSWNGQILDIREFSINERVRIGPSPQASLRIPTLKSDLVIARYNGKATRCLVPFGVRMRVRRGAKLLQRTEIEQSTQSSPAGHVFTMGSEDLVTIDFGEKIRVHLRHAPAPRQLTKAKFVEPDEEIQRTFLGSGIIHLFIALIGVFSAPKEHGPKYNPVSQTQYARLVVPVEEPKPEPTPLPTPIPTPPPPEKVALPQPKLKPIKKVQPKPKKVVVKSTKPINKFPVTLPSKQVAKSAANVGNVDVPSKEVSIKNVSALAALGALGPPTEAPSSQPVAININPNAGGMQSSSPNGAIGVLKAPGGRLQGAGMQGVRTKGQGYGSGTGYGVQGVKGSAGGRAVAGSVVGTPKLMKLTREEGLTQKAVMAEVQKHLGEIQRCYERALLVNPDLAGRVEYEWYITPRGKVNWARVKKTDIGDGDTLNGCVTKVFKTMKFPQAKNGMPTTANIGFPFGRL